MLQRFLDPAVLHGISSLDLVAKTVVDGFVSGCTVRRTLGSAWSLRSIARIRRGTICGMWTGTCLRGRSGAI
jgi:hypothetical protein